MNELRKQILQRRIALDEATVETHSQKVAKRIQQLEVFRQAKHVAFYYAMRGEVSLDKLWKGAASQGKQCYFPVCRDDEMFFVPVTPQTPFIRQSLGFLEPDLPLSEAVPIHQLDLALFPLVAFDEIGVRLGMGKGYYDRAFAFEPKHAKEQPVRLGIAHEFQRQPFLNKQPWDVLLHGTVTETQVYWTN